MNTRGQEHPARLIVTIDTEEEGLWSGRYRRHDNTVENVREIPRFQTLCDEFDVQPVYLIDAPVVEDDFSVSLLREIQDSHRCEIGAHLHPWCNPPFEEEISARNSYMCNLPFDLQRAKLAWLTDKIESRFEMRPASFRAGRYGLDSVGARLLRQAGYGVDSSVIPFSDYSANDGPNFSSAPYTPYITDEDNLCLPGQPETGLLEVPVTVGYNLLPFRAAQTIVQALNGPLVRYLRGEGILDRLGIIRRVKFSPEQANSPAMCRLVDLYLKTGAEVVVMMFHSSSLMPGATPYVQDSQGLSEFLSSIRQVFEHCIAIRQMSTSTLAAFAGLRVPETASLCNGPD